MSTADQGSRQDGSEGPKTGTGRSVKGYDPESCRWEFINPDGTPDEDMLRRVTAAIVEAVNPRRVILFGSAARGEMNERSDLDILVIKDGRNSTTAGEIYRTLPVDRRGTDLVVATTSEVERNRWKPYFVIEPAMREGRVLYDEEGES